MKKLFLAVSLLLTGLAASAQVHIGGGYLLQTFTYEKGAANENLYWPLNGAYAGASFNIRINQYVGIAPGAYFLWATGPLREKKQPAPDISFGLDMMELQFPVNVTFGVELGSAGKLFVYAGPAFNLALTAKMYGYSRKDFFQKRKESLTENLFGEVGEEGEDQITLKRFDTKIGVGVGYRIKFFEINAGYDFGLLNVNKASATEGKLHQNNIHAGIAICF